MQNVRHILNTKVSIYKAGKRRGSARGERRHAEDKKGYGGQKFPKLAKPAKVTKKVTPILTCTVVKRNSTSWDLELRNLSWWQHEKKSY